MPSSNLDCCIYYGAILDKSELQSISSFCGYANVSDFLSHYSLDYRPIGSIAYSKNIIVGKEMHWDYGSYVTEINFDNQGVKLRSVLDIENTDLEINNEFSYINNDDLVEIANSLKSSGIEQIPKFYIITSKE